MVRRSRQLKGLSKMFEKPEEARMTEGEAAKYGREIDAKNAMYENVVVENSMNGSVIRTIGKARAEAQIGLMNLTYNLFRCIQLNVIL